MTSSRFDLDSTSKTLNLFFLRFNERSGSENLAKNTNTSDLQRREGLYAQSIFVDPSILKIIINVYKIRF